MTDDIKDDDQSPLPDNPNLKMQCWREAIHETSRRDLEALCEIQHIILSQTVERHGPVALFHVSNMPDSPLGQLIDRAQAVMMEVMAKAEKKYQQKQRMN